MIFSFINDGNGVFSFNFDGIESEWFFFINHGMEKNRNSPFFIHILHFRFHHLLSCSLLQIINDLFLKNINYLIYNLKINYIYKYNVISIVKRNNNMYICVSL